MDDVTAESLSSMLQYWVLHNFYERVYVTVEEMLIVGIPSCLLSSEH